MRSDHRARPRPPLSFVIPSEAAESRNLREAISCKRELMEIPFT
jgi:hypothetical protein